MTERANQLHHDNALAHSTALVQTFFGKTSHHPSLSPPPLPPRFGALLLLAFPNAEIAVGRDDSCERDGHTVHKFSQRRLTADWLAPRQNDCSWTHSKGSSEWILSYIKATQPVLEIFKMVGYFPDSPLMRHSQFFRRLSTCPVGPVFLKWCSCWQLTHRTVHPQHLLIISGLYHEWRSSRVYVYRGES
jgi:hypothetical protein